MKQKDNLIFNIKQYLEAELSTSRYLHTIRVAETAVEIARLYNINITQVNCAAMLHDITKEKSVEWQRKMLEKNDVTDHYLLNVVPIMHAYTGALYVKEQFGIVDQNVLEAIKYHTIGNINMNDIAKVVYIADYIEPKRCQENVDKIRKLVGCSSLNSIIKAIIENEMEYFRKMNKELHPDTLELYNLIKDEESLK